MKYREVGKPVSSDHTRKSKNMFFQGRWSLNKAKMNKSSFDHLGMLGLESDNLAVIYRGGLYDSSFVHVCMM